MRYTIDPKFGDSIHIRLNAPKLWVRFGANGGRFSVSDFMWNKIEDAAVDPNKYLPYAPYLMHIIEQVVGQGFSHECKHASVRAKHLGPLGPSTAAGSSAPVGGATAPLGGDPSAPPPRSSLERRECGGATRHALKKFMEYFCYTTKRTDERLRRLQERANISPSSPLCDFPDPYEEYDALHGSSSYAAGDEELGGGYVGGSAYGGGDGFDYTNIFGDADEMTAHAAPSARPSSSFDPRGKGIVNYSSESE